MSSRGAGGAAAHGVAALIGRREFGKRLDAMDRKPADAQTKATARSDLPTAVTDVAARMGTDVTKTAAFTDLRQGSSMWFKLMQGEVAWVIDGNDLVYWRGKLESGHAKCGANAGE